jgi:RNA polymerase sigma factor (sigma-70 family)
MANASSEDPGLEPEPTIYLVDDDQAVLDSLRWLIESAGWRVMTFDSAAPLLEAITAEDANPSGCIVADVRLPGMSGLALQQELNRLGIGLPIIIITGHGDVSMAVRAIKAGALDFLEKPFSDQILLDRIRDAMNLDERRRLGAAQLRVVCKAYDSLTTRERQVMREVVAGKSNKQIAADFGVSQKTIEQHRAHVMEKMAADSLAHLVRMAVAIESSPSETG